MIDLYTFTTPNGRKASIALEELGLPYTGHVVDIMKGDQFKPEYLAINPNNKIPAIVDHQGPGGKPLTVFPELLPPVAHVRRWLDTEGARPAVQRGMKVPEIK